MPDSPRSGPATWSSFLKQPQVFLTAIIGAFLIGRVVQVLGGKIFTAHDSAVYAPRTDPSLNHGSLVSFVGNSPRGWGMPIFFALFGNDHARAVGLWTVAVVAWIFLALELAAHMRTPAAKAVAALAVTGLALTNTVASWDFAILSESLTVSFGVAILGFLLRWRRTTNRWWLAVATVLAVWWTFMRPDIRAFILMLVPVLLLVAWRDRRSARPQAVAAGVAVVALLLGVAWFQVTAPRMAERFKPYDGDAMSTGPIPGDQYFFVHRLRTIVIGNPQITATFHDKLGMPNCPEVEAFAAVPEWRVGEFAEKFYACKPIADWAQAHHYDFWGSYFRGAPASAAKTYSHLLSTTMSGDAYASVPRVIPAPVEKLIFGGRWALVESLLGLAAVLALAMAADARRVHSLLLRTGVVVAAMALVSAAATVLEGTGEYRRFGIQETTFFKVALIAIGLCALDAWLSGRRQAAAEPSPAQERTPVSQAF